MRVWPIMTWHLDDKAGEVGLRVKDMAVSEGHTSFTGKASSGTELCFFLPVRTRKELSQGLSGDLAKSGSQLGFGIYFIGSLAPVLRWGGGGRRRQPPVSQQSI